MVILKKKMLMIFILNGKLNNEHIKELHQQQTYSIETYYEMLQQAGFKEIEHYGEFEKYHDKSQRIIFVCRKRRDGK